MVPRKCRYDPTAEEVQVIGGGTLWIGGSGDLIGSADDVAECSVTALRKVLATAGGPEVGVTLYHAAPRELRFDEEGYPEAVSLTFTDEGVCLNCSVSSGHDYRISRQELSARLSPALARGRLRVRELESYDDQLHTTHYLTLDVAGRGRTLSDLVDASDEVYALWIATHGGELDPSAVVDFVRAQRPALLVGTAESSWLEVKRAGYALDRVGQQFELAKDVAAMANAENGGLVLVGLRTEKTDGRDVIRAYTPLDPRSIEPRAYRRVIDSRLYPRPQGVLIERIVTGPDQALLLIIVPRQPIENLPVLVRGAVVDGVTLGSHVGVFRREGDRTVWTDPTALHSLIAAGRSALALGFESAASSTDRPHRPQDGG